VTTRPTIRSVNGLVATDNHLATAAGIAALREGGSAVDAAIAAAAVCTVTQPHRTGIGGDLFALRQTQCTVPSPCSNRWQVARAELLIQVSIAVNQLTFLRA